MVRESMVGSTIRNQLHLVLCRQRF